MVFLRHLEVAVIWSVFDVTRRSHVLHLRLVIIIFWFFFKWLDGREMVKWDLDVVVINNLLKLLPFFVRHLIV